MKHEIAAQVAHAQPGLGPAVAKEYLQARMLQHIALGGHMSSIAFVGDTALRVLYDIPRFSEDLDFSLEMNADRYEFESLLHEVVRGFEREGYLVSAKVQSRRTAVDKAFIRFPGLLHELGLSPHASEVVSVKIEVDTRPPAGALLEISQVRRFVFLRIQHHDRASLFAGKLAAVLMRQYTKGRDLYDLMWYLSDRTWPAPNLVLLGNASVQGGWTGGQLDESGWRDAVLERLAAVDWVAARTEAIQFLEHSHEADLLEYDTFDRLLKSK